MMHDWTPPMETSLPPQSIEAELAVLGAMMIAPEAIVEAMTIVIANDFYRESHRIIFRTAIDIWQSGEKVDPVSVAHRLGDRGMLDAAGGVDALSHLTNAAPHAMHVGTHAKIVHEKAMARRVIAAAQKTITAAHETAGGVTALSESIHRIFHEIDTAALAGGGFKNARELLPETLELMDSMAQDGTGITGLSTGFIDFDELTAGMAGGDLVVVAGRPGQGKTSW